KVGGKTEIVPVGLQPIIDDATPYEATFLAMLTQEKPGVPQWTHKALASYLAPIFEGGGALSQEHGRKLAAWCGQGAAVPASNSNRKADQARERFMASLEKANDFGSLAELDHKLGEHRALLGEHYDECATALQAKVDAMRAAAATEFADEIERLEPDEWKNREGRDEDARQPELLP